MQMILRKICATAGLSGLLLIVGCGFDVGGGLPSDSEQGGLAGSNTTPAPQAGSFLEEDVGNSPAVSASLVEQLSLERVNRARLRPAAEAAAAGIAIDEGIPGQLDTSPKQAVALNATLNGTAKIHSDDMLARDYFTHNEPEGRSPFDRMQLAGYPISFAGENLAWRGTTGNLDPVSTVELEHLDLFVDKGIEDRGHRLVMMNPNLREVGIGISRGAFTSNGVTYTDTIMQTQDFGTMPPDMMFVMGVVYDDRNNNGQYDYGEGRANSTVTMGRATRTTNGGGGYSFRVTKQGAYTLRFASGANLLLNIEPTDKNIKVDLVNSVNIVINLGVGLLD